MRKYQQKQILEFIKTLDELISEIKRLLFREEIQSAMRILEESRVSAIQLVNFIERLENKDTQTAFYLEKYGELLLHSIIKMNNGSSDTRFVKNLTKQLIQIENSVRNELKPDKIEIVFIPYKAAMWDSLESVWLAAKDDPQCDAYVVPVPYFDKLPGGGLGKMHYEGDLFPQYVPITDWRKYNIEARHPDIIFIHNPYDNANYVTSVHPDYYSSKLRNFTDLLCYIPYFVVPNDVAEHFCICPGVLCADKVFVQAEKIRDTYIRVFKDFEKDNNCVGCFGNAQEKFVAVGSPKFDAVINSRPEDFTIPAEWRTLIEQPDGTRKTVVLYNTTVNAILQGSEQYLKKIKHVLEIFRVHDDAVLWWRPHPLTAATYGAMRPKLLDEYEQIVADYKREKFGVYDDTTDLHRAIAVSDAYYGDQSSIVAMYQCTGKSVMIQNINVCGADEDWSNLEFENLCDTGDYFWFTPANLNALFRMNKITFKTEYMGMFPGEEISGYRLYRSIVELNGKLYFVPLTAHSIAVYDIEDNSFSAIKIRDLRSHLELTGKYRYIFHDAIKYEKYIFFIPYWYPAIVRYDTETGEVAYFDDWVNKLPISNTDSGLGYFCEASFHDKKLILPCFNSGAVVELDMEQLSSTVYFSDSVIGNYRSLCYDGNNYWMCTHTGNIVKWDYCKNELVNVKMPERFIVRKENSFCSIRYIENSVWVFPCHASEVIVIDTTNMSVESVKAFQNNRATKAYSTSFSDANFVNFTVVGNKIFAYNCKRNSFIEYDTKTSYYREEKIRISPEDISKISTPPHQAVNKDIALCQEPNDCNFQEAFVQIEDLINYLVHEDDEKIQQLNKKRATVRRNTISHPDGTSGATIFSTSKEMVIES